MLFSSFAFIFIFLPLVWIIFHALKRAHFRHHYESAKIFLIISSLFFYAFWKVAYLPILLGSIIINYALAKAILSKTTIGGGDLDNIFAESALDSANQEKSSLRADSQNLCGKPPNYFVTRIATLISFARNDGNGLSPKFFFILGIIFNLSLLGFFKYTDFLLENFNAFSKLARLDFNIPLPHILLPLAISFVTFQQIAFLFDCFKRAKGELSEELNIDFVDYALFISFFPQLIAGPIVHHREMMPQFSRLGEGNSSLGASCGDLADFGHCADSSLALRPKSAKNYESHTENPSVVDSLHESRGKNSVILSEAKNPNLKYSPSLAEGVRGWVKSTNNNAHSTINYEYLAKGIFIFSIGLFKKVFIADSFAKWANAGFGVVESGGVLNIVESWATSLSYTFQLYFDFSGYCDMAFGLALMFGIVLPLNFDSPYKSLNIAEFWRRWHITLGRFLRECLYIPLGGNRVGKILNLRNLFIVAFLSGLWHGAGWGFVIWGILHGSAMVIHRIYSWIHQSLNQTNALIKFMQTKIYKFLCWLLTFNFVNLAWVFFRAENLNGALNLIKGMFGIAWVELPQKWHRMPETLAQIGGRNDTIFYIVIAFVVCLALKNSFEMLKNFDTQYLRFSFSLRIFSKKIYLKGGAVWTRFVLTIALFYTSIWILLKNMLDSNAYTPFLYFNF